MPAHFPPSDEDSGNPPHNFTSHKIGEIKAPAWFLDRLKTDILFESHDGTVKAGKKKRDWNWKARVGRERLTIRPLRSNEDSYRSWLCADLDAGRGILVLSVWLNSAGLAAAALNIKLDDPEVVALNLLCFEDKDTDNLNPERSARLESAARHYPLWLADTFLEKLHSGSDIKNWAKKLELKRDKVKALQAGANTIDHNFTDERSRFLKALGTSWGAQLEAGQVVPPPRDDLEYEYRVLFPKNVKNSTVAAGSFANLYNGLGLDWL